MRIRFIGSIGVISRSRSAGRRFYRDSLNLPLVSAKGGDFLFTQKLEGSRYFGVWPLSEAARTCFGRDRWPRGHPVPQMFIEFEVGSPAAVTRAAAELTGQGLRLLHPPRTDPWGQRVVRLQTRDGLIVGISFVPWMHPKPRRRAGAARRRPR